MISDLVLLKNNPTSYFLFWLNVFCSHGLRFGHLPELIRKGSCDFRWHHCGQSIFQIGGGWNCAWRMGLLTSVWALRGYRRLLLSSQNSWSSVNVISPEGRLYLPKTTPGTLVPEEVPPSLLQSPLLDSSSRDQISKTDYQDRTCSQGFGENKRKQRKTTLSVKDFEISSNLLFQFGALPGRYKA